MDQATCKMKNYLPGGVLGIGGEGVRTEMKQYSESISTSLALI